jgi:hypothetical protein
MDISFEIPEYEGGLKVFWDQDAKLKIQLFDNIVLLCINKQALLSLARQLMYMAVSDVPRGSHIHYDDFFCKDGLLGDVELIIEKMAD